MAHKEIVVNQNQNILNIITPSALEFKRNMLLMGDNLCKCLTIIKYPTNPDYGWLAKISQIEGVTVNLEFSPKDSGDLVARCNEEIRDIKTSLVTVTDESIRQAKEKGLEDIRNMISKINEDGEIIGDLTLVLMVSGSSEKQLNERTKKVNSIIAGFSGAARVLAIRQKDALKWIAPYGIPNERISDFGGRNMPLSTFLGGFANSASGLNDEIGFMLGRSLDGKPIILNTRKRGGDRTNSNWLVLGVPGVGKSATIKDIVMLEYALGAKAIFLDPEQEYIDLVRNLGGKVISAGGGVGGRINPLQVRPAPRLEEKEEGEEELYHNEGKGVSDVALHYQTFRTFMRTYKKVNEMEIACYEKILEKTYKKFGIEWDTDIKNLKNTDYPIMSDFYDDIKKECEKNPEDEILKCLEAKFYSIAMGSDSFIFNGHTDIDLSADIIDIDISSLMQADENILRAQFHNINSFVWQRIAENRDEFVLYVIDEGYLIIDPENPEAFIFVKNTSKRIRKYGGGLVFATHAIVDLLDPAVKRHGQAIIDNACFKFIMGMDGKNLLETKDLFHLTENEENMLLSKQRGQGILFAGGGRYGIRIEIPEKFLKLMGKAGGQ